MSRQVNFGGWIAIIPNKMVKSWLKRKFIKNPKILDFCSADSDDKHNDVIHRFSLLDDKGCLREFKWCKNKKEMQECKKLGYKDEKHSVVLLDPKIYDAMREEVHKWYDNIFDYVEEWLFRNNLLHIEKGSLQTGFCVEFDPNHEVVKDWGAPLAKENNKVSQMKEKFGFVIVYFYSLTDSEEKMIEKFAKEVERKFDCKTRFI